MLRFITFTDIAVVLLGLVTMAFWFFLYFKGRKYERIFANLDDTDYPMKELYFVGYAFLELTGIQFKGANDRALRRQIEVLYGEKYIDYYLRVSYSQRFTMALTVALMAMPVYCFARSLLLYVLTLVFAGVAYYYYGTVLKEKLDKRSDELLTQFADVASKLALLVNAGMILHDAWKKVAYSGDGIIYSEMKASVQLMDNGYSETDALYVFGQRSMVQEVRKFTSTLIQSLTRGNSEIAGMLTQQSKEIWASKQHLLTRKGEEANSKLLIPMLMIFVGILIMVIVPIFQNLGG